MIVIWLVIVKPDVALFGAAYHGFEQLEAARDS
jgi:hypothetical protein